MIIYKWSLENSFPVSSVLRIVWLERCGVKEVKVHQEVALCQRKLHERCSTHGHMLNNAVRLLCYIWRAEKRWSNTLFYSLWIQDKGKFPPHFWCRMSYIHQLTYLDGSSQFMSFIWSGMMEVEFLWWLYKRGSWPSKSDRIYLKVHLTIIYKSNYVGNHGMG